LENDASGFRNEQWENLEFLEDPRINSENECYCLRLESDGADDLRECAKAGVLRMGACGKGRELANVMEKYGWGKLFAI